MIGQKHSPAYKPFSVTLAATLCTRHLIICLDGADSCMGSPFHSEIKVYRCMHNPNWCDWPDCRVPAAYKLLRAILAAALCNTCYSILCLDGVEALWSLPFLEWADCLFLYNPCGAIGQSLGPDTPSQRHFGSGSMQKREFHLAGLRGLKRADSESSWLRCCASIRSELRLCTAV